MRLEIIIKVLILNCIIIINIIIDGLVVDPNVDPELAMILRISLEEEKER